MVYGDEGPTEQQMAQSKEPSVHIERDLHPADREILAHPDALTIFRLEPDADRRGFHGCRTTKRVDVTTVGSARKKVFEAVDDSIRQSHGGPRMCFNPRHGITAKRGAKTMDVLICFECRQMYVYGDHPRLIAISSDPHDALEAAFKASGL